MDNRKPIDARASGIMVLLCISLGLQQVAIKATAEEIAPVMQIAVRSGIAALLVAMLMTFRHELPLLSKKTLIPGIGLGLLFGLEFLLIAQGLKYTSAAHMTIFLYTAPVFAAIGLHIKVQGEALAKVQWFGIAIAFAGLVIAFSGRGDDGVNEDVYRMLIGDMLGVAAGMAWGASTVTIRCTALSNAPATQTLLYQLVMTFLLLTVFALVTGETQFRLTSFSTLSMVYQVFLLSLATFITWFWLLRRYLASRLGILSLMTPVFGVLFGVFFLGESLEQAFIVGASMVLIGVTVVSGYESMFQFYRYKQAKHKRWKSVNLRAKLKE